jgi:hypothetical protein
VAAGNRPVLTGIGPMEINCDLYESTQDIDLYVVGRREKKDTSCMPRARL